MKPWYQSRTIRLAVLQALVGIVAAFATEYPLVAPLVVLKSCLDIILRLDTESSIK